jgi:hypothetical protein
MKQSQEHSKQTDTTLPDSEPERLGKSERKGHADLSSTEANRVTDTHSTLIPPVLTRKREAGVDNKRDEPKETAARMIFEGKKTKEVALALGVSERQIYRWKNEETFITKQNEFFHHIRDENILRAQAIGEALPKEGMSTKRDLLDWLKFASALTEKIDYTDPRFGIPPEQLGLYMTKATRKSLDRKNKTGRK